MNGRDITSLSARDAARYRRVDLGDVSQSLDLIPSVPAINNAALKPFDLRIGVREAYRRVTPLLERLGLGERLRHRPDQLSTGEGQRVLIARALATSPGSCSRTSRPGSSIRSAAAKSLTLLTEICQEHSVAMPLVTHDPQAATYASRVHTLSDEQLADERAPDLLAVEDR